MPVLRVLVGSSMSSASHFAAWTICVVSQTSSLALPKAPITLVSRSIVTETSSFLPRVMFKDLATWLKPLNFSLSLSLWSKNVNRWMAVVELVSSPDPTFCEGKGLVTVEHFLCSWKLSILVFAQANQIAALWFLCNIAFRYEATLYKISCLGLAVANQNAALQFWIPLRSNVQMARDRLHDIAVKSRICATKKPFQCHLVSFPDPALKEGKGLVHIERFLGLDDISVKNSSTPIRFTPCVIMWHRRILHACESGWCVVMPKRCVAMPITWYAVSCAPQKTLDVYQTLSLLEGGVWKRD